MRRAMGKFTAAGHVNDHRHARVGSVGRMSTRPERADSEPSSVESVTPRSAQRISAARTLWNDRERERLRQRELFRWLVKVDQACGGDAFDIAAIGRDVKVGLENLVLAIETFELD